MALPDSGQAGDLTMAEAIALAAAEILKWSETDDWRARAPARRIFSIYERVRSAKKMSSISARS